eukprot:CAMPEP_0171919408 /NCGR_PEP_ID=MMETSP0993-20121228/18106_1 /TAXON_ID=483369 /ORGANISM="non described non described, Strain CCMP2098" /LENGTH=292 /DNA_ID=CAMNT_0012556055 /DNA_START=1 /DNA_END=879 /DNA_ORIENTATION=+
MIRVVMLRLVALTLALGTVAAWTGPPTALSFGFTSPQRLQRQQRLNGGYRLCAEVDTASSPTVEDVSVIILAGGVGSRMKAGMPKQFLLLRGKPVLQHSIDLFLGLDGIAEVVLVIAPEYRAQFDDLLATPRGGKLKFAEPGKERQDSVCNGLDAIHDAAPLVCIHDAARPLVTPTEIYQVLSDALIHGAAVLGVPMKATVKESADGEFVLRTVDRSRLWEVQTPQVIKPQLLRDGFAKVKAQNLEVTDDVSVIEQLGLPVKLTLGEYTNIKLTTPDDMAVAEQILKSRDPK